MICLNILHFSCLLLSHDIISQAVHQSCSELMTHPAHESFSSLHQLQHGILGLFLLSSCWSKSSAGARVYLPALRLWSQLVEQIAVRLDQDWARLEPGFCSVQCTCGRFFPVGPLHLYSSPWPQNFPQTLIFFIRIFFPTQDSFGNQSS